MFASYDPSSSVLAVASPITHSIMLYDAKNFEKPPFASFDLLGEEERFSGSGKGRNWSKLEFSNDGKSLLVATTGNGHFILDAFDGSLRHFCARPTTKSSSPRSERRAPAETSSSRSVGQGDVSFSPDGAYLVGGNGDEGLAAWDMNGRSGEEGRLETCAEMPVPDKTQGRCEVVGYNPRHNMIVSADREILLWLPDAELAG
jgi:COMPASS component SWD2